MRSRREASGEAGPQITISVWARKAGAKKTRPWMWSRWRWVRRMCRRGGSAGGGDVEAGRRGGEGEPEAADAGAGVERQQRAVGEGDADAGGVAAVADRLRPRGRNRAAGSPELDLHAGPAPLPPASVGQKIAMPPWEPWAVRIGKADT